jgi:hypothetical protein
METADFDAIRLVNPTFNHFHFRFLAVNARSLDVILGADLEIRCRACHSVPSYAGMCSVSVA